MTEKIKPIPVNDEILNDIINEINISINFKSIRESIVAMLIIINNLISQQDEITLDQVFGLLTFLHNRSKN